VRHSQQYGDVAVIHGTTLTGCRIVDGLVAVGCCSCGIDGGYGGLSGGAVTYLLLTGTGTDGGGVDVEGGPVSALKDCDSLLLLLKKKTKPELEGY